PLYPNPGWRVLSVRYQLAHTAPVELVLYDAAGRLVRTLTEGTQPPGYYAVTWDGVDDLGRKVPAGVYFVKFETPDYQKVQKAVLFR
ncbi:T9SS type A sorting domain-containing protein, partial [candidate division WOR-3 bacterium]|nr:T9SS type A sorting domain-containing protein [candidate division WOR-3 bacterium]